MKVAGNGVPWAIGQDGVALLPGLEVPRVKSAGEIRQLVSGTAGLFGGWPLEVDGVHCVDTGSEACRTGEPQ